MNIEHITESPLYEYRGCCPEFGQEITLYAADLRAAEVGTSWRIEDQDRYPNREEVWDVKTTLVYKDEDGVLLKEHESREGTTTLFWIDLYKKLC